MQDCGLSGRTKNACAVTVPTEAPGPWFARVISRFKNMHQFKNNYMEIIIVDIGAHQVFLLGDATWTPIVYVVGSVHTVDDLHSVSTL